MPSVCMKFMKRLPRTFFFFFLFANESIQNICILIEEHAKPSNDHLHQGVMKNLSKKSGFFQFNYFCVVDLQKQRSSNTTNCRKFTQVCLQKEYISKYQNLLKISSQLTVSFACCKKCSLTSLKIFSHIQKHVPQTRFIFVTIH